MDSNNNNYGVIMYMGALALHVDISEKRKRRLAIKEFKEFGRELLIENCLNQLILLKKNNKTGCVDVIDPFIPFPEQRSLATESTVSHKFLLNLMDTDIASLVASVPPTVPVSDSHSPSNKSVKNTIIRASEAALKIP